MNTSDATPLLTSPDDRKAALQEAARSLADELNGILDILIADKDSDTETLLRKLTHDLYAMATRQSAVIDLMLSDIQTSSAVMLSVFERRSVIKLLAAFEKIKRDGALRPMPTAVLIRTYLSALIGYLATERLMPGTLKVVSRLMPNKAWLDGLIDLMLFGMLEDHDA